MKLRETGVAEILFMLVELDVIYVAVELHVECSTSVLRREEGGRMWELNLGNTRGKGKWLSFKRF